VNGSREDMMLKVAEAKSASLHAHCQNTAKKPGSDGTSNGRAAFSQSTDPDAAPTSSEQ
jgi:hypothetical protein